jgi:type IV secretion system protein VirB4
VLNLAEYRRKADRLADHLPWAALVAPGVVLNKDGSFQRTLVFRGPDLESATEAELVSACARANNVLRRFGGGWALFFDAERREAATYPGSAFPDAASWLVEQERRAAFLAEGAHFESRTHLTLVWLPPADASDAAGRSLVERPYADRQRDWQAALASFVAETGRARDLLAGFMPEVRMLDDAETLSFLHGAISDRRHGVASPDTPMYLDGLLADTPLVGGLEPMLGGKHLRTLTVLNPRRAQSSGFRLSLGYPLRAPRQGGRSQGPDRDQAAMVQQAQVRDRDAARGDVQPAGPAHRQRRRQQGRRCGSRAAGAGWRPCRVRLPDCHHHRRRRGPRAR